MVPPTELESRAKPPKPYNCQCSASEAVAGTGSLLLSVQDQHDARCGTEWLFADRWTVRFVIVHYVAPHSWIIPVHGADCALNCFEATARLTRYFFLEILLSIEQYYLDKIRAPGVPGIYIEISQTLYMSRFTCKFLFISFIKYSPPF